MTTIVGIQGDGFAVLGADSRVSTVFDDVATMKTTLASSQTKLCTVGKYGIAVAGDIRGLNLIQHAFNPPQPAAALKGRKLDGFITTKFIPSLRECFESNGYSTAAEKDGRSQIQHGAELMVMINSTIYMVESDYGWGTDTKGIYAGGTGSSYALGALDALMTSKPFTLAQAKKIALRALNVAAKYDPFTGAPFGTLSQEISRG